MSFSKTIRKKIRHRACLEDLMSQTYPIYACTGTNQAHHFIGSHYIFLRLEASIFKSDSWNNLIGRKCRTFGKKGYIIWGKIKQIKTTSTQNVPRVVPFKVINLHPRVTGTLLTLSFFPCEEFLLNFPKLKGTNCTPKPCIKNIGHCARSRAKEYRFSSLGSWIENNNLFSECAGTHSPD